MPVTLYLTLDFYQEMEAGCPRSVLELHRVAEARQYLFFGKVVDLSTKSLAPNPHQPCPHDGHSPRSTAPRLNSSISYSAGDADPKFDHLELNGHE